MNKITNSCDTRGIKMKGHCTKLVWYMPRCFLSPSVHSHTDWAGGDCLMTAQLSRLCCSSMDNAAPCRGCRAPQVQHQRFRIKTEPIHLRDQFSGNESATLLKVGQSIRFVWQGNNDETVWFHAEATVSLHWLHAISLDLQDIPLQFSHLIATWLSTSTRSSQSRLFFCRSVAAGQQLAGVHRLSLGIFCRITFGQVCPSSQTNSCFSKPLQSKNDSRDGCNPSTGKLLACFVISLYWSLLDIKW